MLYKIFDKMFDLMHDIKDDVKDKFNATIFAQKRVFFNNADDEINNAKNDKISIEKIAKKNIDFDVQLLIILHCFSDIFADAFSNSISMLDMIEKNSLKNANIEINMIIANVA